MKRPITIAAAGLLMLVGACSASGTLDEPKLGPTDAQPEGDAFTEAGPPDSGTDIDLDAARPLVCGDAGFCETRLPTSPLGLPLSLRSVWIVGPKDVWSVTLEGVVLHYDGTRWAIEYSANHELYAVWATSTNVWVGGEGGLLLRRSAAGNWSRVDAGHVAPIRAIYGTGDDDVWFARGGSSLDRFDGAMLKNIPTGVSGLEITTVFGRPGFGTYAAGYVPGELATSGVLPDQPYVFELSSTGISVFSASLAEERGFVPMSGVVTDSADEQRRVFLIGYEYSQLVIATSQYPYFNIKYCFVGVGSSVAIETTNVSAGAERVVGRPFPILDYGGDDVRLVWNLGSVARWDRSVNMSLGMGYDFMPREVSGAHNTSTEAWLVGDGFALKGAMR
jgi:hypothetical protein